LNFSPREIALTAVFASLYAIGTIVLAPTSYGVIQCRVADSLIPLSVLFGYPTVIGVTLGCVVANVYGGFGVIDIVFGSLANLLASALAYKLRNKPLLACTASTLVVTFIVGSYLWILFEVPWEFSILGVFVGSLLSMNVLGFALIEGLRRSGIVRGE